MIAGHEAPLGEVGLEQGAPGRIQIIEDAHHAVRRHPGFVPPQRRVLPPPQVHEGESLRRRTRPAARPRTLLRAREGLVRLLHPTEGGERGGASHVGRGEGGRILIRRRGEHAVGRRDRALVIAHRMRVAGCPQRVVTCHRRAGIEQEAHGGEAHRRGRKIEQSARRSLPQAVSRGGLEASEKSLREDGVRQS